MLIRTLLLGMGCLLWACTTSTDGSLDRGGGSGNTAGHSGTAGASDGGGGSSAAAGSSGMFNAGSGGAASAAGAGGISDGGAAGAAGASGMLNAGGATGGSGGAANTGGAPASMAEVQTIFDYYCVNCHDAGKLGLPAFPQLSLIATDAHAALVNKLATQTCGGTLVVPGQPDQSYLMHKLSEATPCEGGRMPHAFEIGIAAPLSAEDLTTIRSWISAGAKP